MILASGALATAKDYSRKGAKPQRSDLRLPGGSSFAPLRLCASNLLQQPAELTIDVFQILDLPLSIHEASLIKTEKGYLLRLSLGNSSELKMIGLRYSLASIGGNGLRPLVNRTEALSLPAYATKSLTFKTPIRFKPKNEERLVLMLEQVISRESIWEVI